MRVSRGDLKKIVENYLLLEKINEELIQNMFEKTVNDLQEEFKNSGKFDETVRNSVADAIGKTHLYIVPKNDAIYDNPEAAGYEGFALHVKFDNDGNPKGEKLNANIIKDKTLQQKYVSNAVVNPIVVIFEKNVKNKQELKRLMFHELGHVKNNFLKFYAGINLNVDEVRDVIRKDFKNKDVKQIIKALRAEKRLGKLTPPGFASIIEKYKEYYDGLFAEPPDELSVDEFAVRISGLQRDIVAQASVAPRDNPMKFTKMKKNYGVDSAGLALFLDKDVNYEKIQRIAKAAKSSGDKSATA